MTCIVSLSPSMQKRMNFQHELLDTANDYRLTEPTEDREQLILGHMWLVKDIIMRFRAHWPMTRRLTDDLVSAGLEALAECNNWELNKVQKFVTRRLEKYINDNRAIVWASRSTNERRQADDLPLEYHYPVRLNEYLHGIWDENYTYVDLLDSIEKLAETDTEEMQSLITLFLKQKHGIDEESLSDEERAAVDQLSKIGKTLL